MLEVANSFNRGVGEDGIGELLEGVPEEVLELEQERTAEEEAREKEIAGEEKEKPSRTFIVRVQQKFYRLQQAP